MHITRFRRRKCYRGKNIDSQTKIKRNSCTWPFLCLRGRSTRRERLEGNAAALLLPALLRTGTGTRSTYMYAQTESRKFPRISQKISGGLCKISDLGLPRLHVCMPCRYRTLCFVIPNNNNHHHLTMARSASTARKANATKKTTAAGGKSSSSSNKKVGGVGTGKKSAAKNSRSAGKGGNTTQPRRTKKEAVKKTKKDEEEIEPMMEFDVNPASSSESESESEDENVKAKAKMSTKAKAKKSKADASDNGGKRTLRARKKVRYEDDASLSGSDEDDGKVSIIDRHILFSSHIRWSCGFIVCFYFCHISHSCIFAFIRLHKFPHNAAIG